MRAVYLGVVPYDTAAILQEQFFYGKLLAQDTENAPEDIILFLEHPPVYTYGISVKDPKIFIRDYPCFKKLLSEKKIEFNSSSRGGLMTFHGPGQIVCYPILDIGHLSPKQYMSGLEKVVRDTLADFGIKSVSGDGGIWVNVAGNEQKICSFGIRIKRAATGSRVAMHGFALNISTDMSYFEAIYPCGIQRDSPMLNLTDLLGETPDLRQLSDGIAQHFSDVFGQPISFAEPENIGFYQKHKPAWLRVPLRYNAESLRIKNSLKAQNLHTVCEEARCPNIGECWNDGGATIMILGDVCTRSCGFCAVSTGKPAAQDASEALRAAKAICSLPHQHIVLTSVNRDELEDGGSIIWAATVKAIRALAPTKTVEVLVPDFKGQKNDIQRVLNENPEVFGHNIETVRRLYSRVRPQGSYERSLNVLTIAAESENPPIVKSNIMLGHGESEPEIISTMHDLKEAGVRILTITQYLRPTLNQLPVIKYYSPDDFKRLEKIAEKIGLSVVISGPLVRSSYHASQAYKKALAIMGRARKK